MNRALFAVFVLFFSEGVGPAQAVNSVRQTPFVPQPPTGYSRALSLWTGEAPLAKGTKPEDVPKLYYYPATAPGLRSAVIVLPGGSYVHELMEKEGAFPAEWLASRGVAAFVLQYRLAPEYRYPAPMLDGIRAVRYVRSHAAEFGVDPARIGVWGFSAGGHLAGYLATAETQSDKKNPDPVERMTAHPDFAIFSYARLSMDPAIPRPNSMEALIGNHPRPEMVDTVWIARHVTKETSPSFIYSTTGDETVDSRNATAYYDACKREGVAAELHVFEQGAHGTGMGQNIKGMGEVEIWPLLLQHWMQLHGWMPLSAIDK